MNSSPKLYLALFLLTIAALSPSPIATAQEQCPAAFSTVPTFSTRRATKSDDRPLRRLALRCHALPVVRGNAWNGRRQRSRCKRACRLR